jgi:hypothetical protein
MDEAKTSGCWGLSPEACHKVVHWHAHCIKFCSVMIDPNLISFFCFLWHRDQAQAMTTDGFAFCVRRSSPRASTTKKTKNERDQYDIPAKSELSILIQTTPPDRNAAWGYEGRLLPGMKHSKPVVNLSVLVLIKIDT